MMCVFIFPLIHKILLIVTIHHHYYSFSLSASLIIPVGQCVAHGSPVSSQDKAKKLMKKV